MDKELQTFEMRVRPLIFGTVYLNVPGGNYIHFNKELISAVEYLGNRYGTIPGSNLKKGIHYIQTQTTCSSKRQIKMMLRNVENSRIAYEDDTAYLFRCSIKHYAEVLKFIVENAPINLPTNMLYTDYLVPEAKDGINFVAVHAIDQHTQDVAASMYNSLSF